MHHMRCASLHSRVSCLLYCLSTQTPSRTVHHISHSCSSFSLNFCWRGPSTSCFQSMCMPRSSNHLSLLLLLAYCSVDHPLVLEHFVHRCSLQRINFQHPPDYMSAFTGQDPQQAPRAFDDFLFISTRCARPFTVCC